MHQKPSSVLKKSNGEDQRWVRLSFYIKTKSYTLQQQWTNEQMTKVNTPMTTEVWFYWYRSTAPPM